MLVRTRHLFDQSYRVRVSGLPFQCKRIDVLKFLSNYGPVDCVSVTTETGKPTGQALVSFSSIEEALAAANECNSAFLTPDLPGGSPRRLSVTCDFKGPRVVRDTVLPREPNPRRLIKLVRDKAVGAKWPTEPVMASTNESRMLRRYKTGGLPRAHDRQR
jgi:RNA recognition motif-containing protein